MGIRIGTIFTGTVDAVAGESIQTKFFMIGVPLVPMQSYFVLNDRGNGIDGFAIPLSPKSVGLAYLRWSSFIGAIIGGVTAMVAPSYRRGFGDFFVLGLFTALWIVSTFVLGRCDGETKTKRMLFKAATGVSALPAMLPFEVAEKIHASLKEAPPQSGNAAWTFVSASYRAHVERDGQAQRTADDAWAQLKALT